MKKPDKGIVVKIITAIALAMLMLVFSFNFQANVSQDWSQGNKNVYSAAITKGDVLIQRFPAKFDIKELYLNVKPSGKNAGAKIQVQLIDHTQDDTVLYDEILSTDTITKAEKWTIPLFTDGINPNQEKQRDKLSLVLTGVDGTEDNSICVQVAADAAEKMKLTLNEERLKGRMIFSYEYDTPFNVGYFIGAVVLLVLAYLILFWEKLRTWKPQQCFVLMALAAGILLISLVPPVQAPDELYHFQKSVDVSYGNLSPFMLTTNESIYELTGPEDIMNLEKEEIYSYSMESRPEKAVFRSLSLNGDLKTIDSTGGFHPFVGYIPQAIGILFARLFQFNGLYTLYIARFMNLLAYIALTYFAIKKIPFGKHILMVLACTPICLAQAASVSSDAVCNGAAFLLVALILHYAFAYEGTLGLKQMLGVAGLILVLAFVKYLYAILALLVFLIPQEKFGSKKNYWTTFLEIVIPLAVIFVIYYMFVGNYIANQEPAKNGVDAMAQLQYSLTNPKSLFITYLLTFERMTLGYLEQFNTLGALNFQLGILIPIVPLFLLYTAVTDTQETAGLQLKQKTLTGITAGLIVVLVMFSMYLVWTPVGVMVIDGVQARYFVPALPLIFLCIRSRKLSTTIAHYTNKISFVSMLCLWATVCYMVRLCY